jgi:hypothetical protein
MSPFHIVNISAMKSRSFRICPRKTHINLGLVLLPSQSYQQTPTSERSEPPFDTPGNPKVKNSENENICRQSALVVRQHY